MNKLIISVFFVSLFLGVNGFSPNAVLTVNQDLKITAVYVGFDDLGNFQFVDSKKVNHSFHEIAEEIEIDLYDEVNENLKFEVTWIVYQTDEYDDEGDPTGQQIDIKRIVKLVKI